jgi:hypothetical protein
MAKLTAKERAALAKQILAADDEDDEDEPQKPETDKAGDVEEDDDYVIYKGKKYRPEVVEEVKEAEAEAEEEEEAPKPKKRRFVT